MWCPAFRVIAHISTCCFQILNLLQHASNSTANSADNRKFHRVRLHTKFYAMERVVDRSELLESESDAPPSPDLEDRIALDEFEFVQREHNAKDGAAPDDDDEMDFCLFAPSANVQETATPARIRVNTPPVDVGDAGFLSARDDSYYFASAPSLKRKEQLRSAAVTGQDVLSRAHGIWPGSAYPWKVLHLPSTKKQRSMLANADSLSSKLFGNDASLSRKRPGKKARLKIRTRAVAAKARQEQKQREADLKEAAEQEKRTRRNREKKVKRKQREKAKKAAESGAADQVDADSQDDSSAG